MFAGWNLYDLYAAALPCARLSVRWGLNDTALANRINRSTAVGSVDDGDRDLLGG